MREGNPWISQPDRKEDFLGKMNRIKDLFAAPPFHVAGVCRVWKSKKQKMQSGHEHEEP